MGTGDAKKFRKNNPAARQRAGHIIERYVALFAKKFFNVRHMQRHADGKAMI